MKSSFYNIIIKNDKFNNYLIYNAYRNSLVEVENEIAESIMGSSPGKVDNDEYRKMLVECGVLVNNEEDEIVHCINAEKVKRSSKMIHWDRLTIIIVPTVACNFRCQYCFEKKDAKPLTIDHLLLKDTIEWIKHTCKEYQVKTFHLTWFGGEPLLCKDKIISTLVELKQFCIGNHIEFSSDMITNGILLDKKTTEILVENHLTSCQITIDGVESIHNKRRFYPKSPDENFKTLLSNIQNSDERLRINIRINIDKETYDHAKDLVEYLISKKVWPYRKNTKIDFSYVSDADKTKPYLQTYQEFSRLRNEFRLFLVNTYNEIFPDKKAKFKFEYPNFMEDLCGFSFYSNTWAIDQKGDFYRCMENGGSNINPVGNIYELIENKKTLTDLLESSILTTEYREEKGCYKCKFLPVCNFRCPYGMFDECSAWKDTLEQKILFQYNLYKENPGLIDFGTK